MELIILHIIELSILALMAIQLVKIKNKQDKVIMNQDELASSLEETNVKIQKAITEIVAAIAASGSTTPRVDAAVGALKAAAQALDDLNPDAA